MSLGKPGVPKLYKDVSQTGFSPNICSISLLLRKKYILVELWVTQEIDD